MIPEDKAPALGLLYHLNSEPWSQSPSANPPPPQTFKRILGDWPPVDLPRSRDDSPLLALIRARRSCRAFSTGTVSLADLGEIIRGTYGMSWDAGSPDWLAPPPRAVPSAGGCYPLEAYVAAHSVRGLDAGVYHYSIVDHSLEVIRLGDLRGELCRLMVGQTELAGACAVLIFAAVFQRTLTTYGARGYRYVLLEAGHAAQNTCLIATELGLGSLCLGGFFDARLNRFLGLDGVTEAALYGVAVGLPAH
jgi:SagB-type dehydrogenase family enzyme